LHLSRLQLLHAMNHDQTTSHECRLCGASIDDPGLCSECAPYIYDPPRTLWGAIGMLALAGALTAAILVPWWIGAAALVKWLIAALPAL
jgi:hypothetical protein